MLCPFSTVFVFFSSANLRLMLSHLSNKQKQFWVFVLNLEEALRNVLSHYLDIDVVALFTLDNYEKT